MIRSLKYWKVDDIVTVIDYNKKIISLAKITSIHDSNDTIVVQYLNQDRFICWTFNRNGYTKLGYLRRDGVETTDKDPYYIRKSTEKEKFILKIKNLL